MTITNFLIAVLVFLLVLVILGQLGRITDYIGKLNKKQVERYEGASNWNGIIFFLVGIIGMAIMVWSYFALGDRYLPEAASELGRQYDKLFYWIFSPPIVLVFFITHICLFYFVWKYRYNRNRKAHYFSHSNKLEMIWTSVPLITMVILGIFTIPKWVKATGAPSEDAMHIKVTGMQFKWFMAYAGADGEFGERDIREYGSLSNLLGLNPEDSKGYDDIYVDELVLPKGQEIAFDLSALDVLHDFYLPHFRIKMDCVPGVPTRMKIIPDRTTEEMREITGNPDFNYEIACAELCGTGHWNMRRTIRVVEPEEFQNWVKEQTTAKDLYYNSLLADLAKKNAEAVAAPKHDTHGVEHDVQVEDHGTTIEEGHDTDHSTGHEEDTHAVDHNETASTH